MQTLIFTLIGKIEHEWEEKLDSMVIGLAFMGKYSTCATYFHASKC
jgi:hypothetical protein